MSQRDRVVFQRLAVFAGSWTLEATEAVVAGGDVDHAEVLDRLTSLIDQSVVVVVDNQTSQRRFRMLETLRQYGWERFLETGEANDVK